MLSFAIADVLPYGRQEKWQDVPEGWPQEEIYRRWLSSKDVAAMYGDPDA